MDPAHPAIGSGKVLRTNVFVPFTGFSSERSFNDVRQGKKSDLEYNFGGKTSEKESFVNDPETIAQCSLDGLHKRSIRTC